MRINRERLRALHARAHVLPPGVVLTLGIHADGARGACRRRGKRVCPIEIRSGSGMRRNGMGRLRHMRGDGVGHRVMMVQRGRLRPRWSQNAALLLLLFRFQLAAFGGRHHGIGSIRVGGMIKESADVVDEQRVQELRYFFFVCKVQRPLKRNPIAELAPNLGAKEKGSHGLPRVRTIRL